MVDNIDLDRWVEASALASLPYFEELGWTSKTIGAMVTMGVLLYSKSRVNGRMLVKPGEFLEVLETLNKLRNTSFPLERIRREMEENL